MLLLALVTLGQSLGNRKGRVVLPPALRHGPFHHGADALTHPCRRFRLFGPDGGKHGQHISGRHLTHFNLADAGEGVGFKRGQELRAMLGIAPRWQVQGVNLARGFLKGQHGHCLKLGLLGIAARLCQFAVFQSFGPCLGQ